jgi:hypothetical protein
MALIVDPDFLSQGLELAVSNAVFASSAGANTVITSATNLLPKLVANDYFEVRDHSVAGNNGLYIATGVPTVANLPCTKVDGTNPTDSAAEAIRTFGDNVEDYGVPTNVAITGTTTITKSGGVSFITAGFKVGGHVTITSSEDPTNDGVHILATVAADVLTTTGLTNNADDDTMHLYVGSTAEYKSVMIDVDQKRVYLIEKGSLSVDGATLQAIYSFLKEEWKSDADLIRDAFPVVSITPEQFEFIEGWEPRDNASPVIQSKKLIRTAGWSEVSTTDIVTKQYTGVVTLGSFEDSVNDTAYYQLGSDPDVITAATDFTFAGPVNEAVKTYEDYGVVANTVITGGTTITKAGGTSFVTFGFKVGGRVTILTAEDTANNGSWVLTAVAANVLTTSGLTNNADDDTIRLAADNRNAVNVFLRERDGDPNGKTYDKSTVSAIGFSAVDNKAFRFPLSNATDLNIDETDANIAANSPYTQILVRYFDQAFNREVDSGTNRNFGIVIDVGTHSGVDGSAPGGASVLTTVEAGMGVNAYAGGVLRIHEGTDENVEFPIVSNAAGTITVTGTIAAGSNLSFTAQRATPIVASKQEIYEKVQYLLRQAADIDTTDQTVTGRTGDELLTFVGADLLCGVTLPSNPNGGGSGVIIEGFDANDTNNLFFYDNLGAVYNYPFVAAGNIGFNANLYPSDSAPEYWMFFEYTLRDVVPDFAISTASGSTASFDSAGSNLPTVAQNDYVRLTDMTNAANNGIWVVTDAAPSGTQFDARKIDGATVVNEVAASHPIDLDPIDSPQAIIVNNNAGNPIAGNISSASVAFDFDYDNNVQGGRTAATDAPIIIRAIGLEDAQFAETTGTITRATGLAFSVVAALERNYSNP